MKRLATVVAVGLLGAAVAAPPALAKQPSLAAATRIATDSVTGAGSVATATASCPAAMRATGGGFEAPSSMEAVGVVFESRRAGQRGWRASAQLLDPGAPSSLMLATYVYCERSAPKSKVRRATVTTPGAPQLGPTASARCRPAEDALSGGFAMPPPLIGGIVTALVFDSHRNGDSAWDTRVASGAAAPGTVTSEIYCARKAKAGPERTATSPLSSTFFERSTATASCAPSAERTGGFAQPLSQLMSFLFIYESQRVVGGWRVSGLHSGSNPGVAVSALAYCG